jgi:hypothetical protein
MKNLKLFLAILLFSYSLLINAQYEENSLPLTDTSLSNFSYALYPDNTFVKSTLQSISEIDNSTPNGLVNSILSESSLEWININNATKADVLSAEELSDLNKKKALNKNTNFVQLVQQINFTFNSESYKYIKYCLHNDKSAKLPFGFYLIVNRNNLWKRVNQFDDSNQTLINYSFTFFRFNFTKLNDIFSKNNKASPLMTDIINKTHSSQGFSLSRLEQELNEWNYNSSSEKHQYFIEKLNWE